MIPFPIDLTRRNGHRHSRRRHAVLASPPFDHGECSRTPRGRLADRVKRRTQRRRQHRAQQRQLAVHPPEPAIPVAPGGDELRNR